MSNFKWGTCCLHLESIFSMEWLIPILDTLQGGRWLVMDSLKKKNSCAQQLFFSINFKNQQRETKIVHSFAWIIKLNSDRTENKYILIMGFAHILNVAVQGHGSSCHGSWHLIHVKYGHNLLCLIWNGCHKGDFEAHYDVSVKLTFALTWHQMMILFY